MLLCACDATLASMLVFLFVILLYFLFFPASPTSLSPLFFVPCCLPIHLPPALTCLSYLFVSAPFLFWCFSWFFFLFAFVLLSISYIFFFSSLLVYCGFSSSLVFLCLLFVFFFLLYFVLLFIFFSILIFLF